jgi:hypothetical protein
VVVHSEVGVQDGAHEVVLLASQPGVDDLRHVVAEDPDTVTALRAQRKEARAEPVRGLIELGEGLGPRRGSTRSAGERCLRPEPQRSRTGQRSCLNSHLGPAPYALPGRSTIEPLSLWARAEAGRPSR